MQLADPKSSCPVFRTKPWEHQLAAFEFARNKRACMLAMDMGTGKTKVAIDLVMNDPRWPVLIICPKAVLSVWRRELSVHCHLPQPPLICREIPGRELTTMCERHCHAGASPVIVINYDLARSRDFAAWSMMRQWGWVILDESHRIKAATGITSQVAAKLARNAGRRLCLTGTPMPHSPLDLFGQYRFLDRAIFGTYFVRFRARYAITHHLYHNQVLRWINQDELHEKFYSIAFRVDNSVLNLPDVIHDTRTCTFGSESRQQYNALVRDLIAEVKGGVVRADNALVKLLRLQQLTSGIALIEGRDENGVAFSQIHQVNHAKLMLLHEMLEDMPSDEPIVVFCRFVRDVDNVRDIAGKLNREYGELSGRHNNLTPDATIPDNVRILGVQIQSGSLGVDLSKSRFAIFYSLGFSLGDYEQALARLHRPGQKAVARYYHLCVEDTIDEIVYAALRKRKDVIETVLSHFQGVRDVRV